MLRAIKSQCCWLHMGAAYSRLRVSGDWISSTQVRRCVGSGMVQSSTFTLTAMGVALRPSALMATWPA